MDSEFKRVLSPSLSLLVMAALPPRGGASFCRCNLYRRSRKRMPAGHQMRLPYLLFNLGYRKYGKIAARLARQLGLMNLYGRLARHLSYGI